MLTRRAKGHRPQIIFTSDYHELVRGDLIPGPCVLRYDPHRIVEATQIQWLPATGHPVTAHVRCHPSNEYLMRDMRFAPATRLLVDADPTGQGTMLETEFPIPDNCEELECWFSYTANGVTRWDSEMGSNYWVRFPTHDFDIHRCELRTVPNAALGQLELEIESISDVEAIDIRWRYTQLAGQSRQQRALQSMTLESGRKQWSRTGGGIPVASGTTIAFDLVYAIRGHSFTDDNDGTWYVVGPQ